MQESWGLGGCAGSLPNKLKRECAKNTPEGSMGEAEGSTIFYMGEALRIGPLTSKTYYFSIVYHGDGE